MLTDVLMYEFWFRIDPEYKNSGFSKYIIADTLYAAIEKAEKYVEQHNLISYDFVTRQEFAIS